ncbi:MAG TPA: gliding motility protein GldL [Chitinophagaceae bacterium]|nr:gliding motility protein GldL [Chitinophagaceae bacterium]
MAINAESKKGKKIMNFIFSFGAAVVILGALFKILHWRGATGMLMAGMFTEVAIFTIYALLPPPSEYYWEKYYPGIRESPEDELARTGKYVERSVAIGTPTGTPALQGLDKMMMEADITPASLKQLKEGFTKLHARVSDLADLSDAMEATKDYTVKTREAVAVLGNMKAAYTSAAAAVSTFNDTSESTKKFHDSIQHMTRNLASLNTIYELELQDTNSHLKALNKFYTTLSAASETMSQSAADAKKTQEQIAILARNLGNLNAIYGNMLSAMQGRG